MCGLSMAEWCSNPPPSYNSEQYFCDITEEEQSGAVPSVLHSLFFIPISRYNNKKIQAFPKNMLVDSFYHGGKISAVRLTFRL